MIWIMRHAGCAETMRLMEALMPSQSLVALCVALGAGLLVGAERERRKGSGPTRSAAGIRTFAVSALSGATAMLLGGPVLMAVVALIVGGFALLSYRRSSPADPGMTTEIALLLICLIGGVATSEPVTAAALGAMLAALLAARDRIHHFVGKVLSERELHDAILFAAAGLIALPLAPDRLMGPFDAWNPRVLVSIVVLVMGISAAGYVALRLLGPRIGFAVAGLASGFISATATIHSMGERTRREPHLMAGLAAGAALASVATIIQLALVLAVVAPSLLAPMALPCLLAGLAAAAYGAWFTRKAWREVPDSPLVERGRAFDLASAVGFAALVGAVQAFSAALTAWFGAGGTLLAAAASGLADAHAAAVSVGGLFAAAKIESSTAMTAILLGLTANTLVKAIAACLAGGRPFAARLAPGLAAMIAAAWLGTW